MKIAFYLDSIRSNMDYSDPTKPNPGIGGTQYMIWAISYYIKKNRPDYDIWIIANKDIKVADNLSFKRVDNKENAITFCHDFDIDFLVLRGPYLSSNVYRYINKYAVKIIIWSHNFETYRNVKPAEACKYVVQNICVSQEQADLLRDTKLFDKTSVIHNAINMDEYSKIRQAPKKNVICYIGNLYPRSGYESLAKIWPMLEKKHPELELYIIGGNKLYNNEDMNSNYSSNDFKKLKRLTNSSFENKKNVHFTGVLGGFDKLLLMAEAYVGVSNLTQAGETFGLSAIEFEALGVPVISNKKYGIRETVNDGQTGLLAENETELGKLIDEIISNPKLHKKLAENGPKFVFQHFNLNDISHKWIKLFDNLYKGHSIVSNYDCSKFSYDNKRIIFINYLLKKNKLLSKLPTILFYKYIIYAIKREKNRFLGRGKRIG